MAECNKDELEPIDIAFDWGNEEWALRHLPWVRAATHVLRKDRAELAQVVGRMIDSGSAPDILEAYATTKVHLEAMVDLLATAMARQFAVLEQLGYSPDLPPPGHDEMQMAH